MIAWFIIAIITIGLFAYIAFFGVQAVNVTADGTALAETVRRVEAAAAGLKSRAVPGPDGALYLPIGTVSAVGATAGTYTLPQSLADAAATPFGGQMTYCPFGDPGSSPDQTVTITMAGGASYQAGIKRIGGQSYVVAGRPSYADAASNPNILGFVMASLTRAQGPRGCDAITKAGNGYIAPGMVVRPILRDAIAEATRVLKSDSVIFYVSPAGTGDGLNAGTPTTLTAALTYWRAHPIKGARIIASAGTYSIANGMMQTDGPGYVAHPAGSTLHIQGSGINAVQITQSAGTSNAINVSLSLKDLTFLTGTETSMMQGTSLLMENVRIGSIVALQGARVKAQNLEVLNPSASWLIRVAGGSTLQLAGNLQMTYSNNQNGIAVFPGSVFTSNYGAVTFAPASGTPTVPTGMLISAQGKAHLSYTQLYFNGPFNTAIVNSGFLTTEMTDFYANRGGNALVALDPGSSSNFEQLRTMGSSSATIGILDRGGHAIAGSGVLRSRTACWSTSVANANLFALSPAGTNNASSTVTPDEAVPAVTAVPTAASVIAFEAANTRNTLREHLRVKNRTNFSCQIGV